MIIVDPRLLGVFGLVCLLLSLKALLLGAATAATRGLRKQFLNAEDADWLGGQHVIPDPEPVARIGRAHRNDLENLLLFGLSGGVYLLSGASSVAGAIYCVLFLVARLLHSAAYLGRRPLLRRNAYTIGFLAIVAMSIHAAAALSQGLLLR